MSSKYAIDGICSIGGIMKGNGNQNTRRKPVPFSPYLTSCSGIFLEKLTGPQLVKKLSAFYGTRRFITVFTTVNIRETFHLVQSGSKLKG